MEKLSLITLNLILPVGISFYTFQALSYVIDVYRGVIPAERKFLYYATFISFFPQLVAGPIERTSNLLPQIKAEHKFDEKKAMTGAKLIVWGYFKKLIIADNIAPYVDRVYNNLTEYTHLDLMCVIFFFTLQIYCDFSGYSDIAIGTAKLFNIDFMTNFKSPYFSESVKDFWRRWHISLSTWFKDYIYIPLGGNRCSKIRSCINLMITFLLSGLWHGASWTYVAWGGLHGLAQMIEKLFEKQLNKVKSNKVGRTLSVLFVFIFCNFAWVFFRAESFSDAIYVIENAFVGISHPTTYLSSNMLSLPKLLLLLIYVCILFVYDYKDYKSSALQWLESKHLIMQWILYIILALIIVFCSQKGRGTEFVYFQF